MVGTNGLNVIFIKGFTVVVGVVDVCFDVIVSGGGARAGAGAGAGAGPGVKL